MGEDVEAAFALAFDSGGWWVGGWESLLDKMGGWIFIA